MAAKVNKKFVIILSVVLVALFVAVAGVGAYLLTQTGARHMRTGDAAAARGDYETATKAYAKAVAKERTNVAYLRTWRDAMTKWTPTNETEYDEYYGHYIGSFRAVAVVEQTNPKAQGEYLATLMKDIASRPSPDSWASLAEQAGTALSRLNASDPETQKIRRYRGLPTLYRSRSVEMPDTTLQQMREDLEAAAKADPSDMETALGLIEMMTSDAARLSRSRQVDEASKRMQEAQAAAKELIARAPKDPRPLLRLWQIRADLAQQNAINPAERQKAIQSIAGDLDPIVEAIRGSDAIDAELLRNVSLTLIQARPTDGLRLSLGMVDAALAKRADDPSIMILRGQILAQLEEGRAAIEQLQKVAALPEKPISLEGRILRESRVLALQLQIDQLLSMTMTSSEEKQKAALLAEAKARRDDLVKRVGEKHLSVLRSDGRMAYVENRNAEAIRLLTDLATRTQNRDSETLFLLATALMRDGSIGGAVQQYDKVLANDPSNVAALQASADLELRLENIDSARARLNRVLTVDPTNESALRTLRLIDAVNKEDVQFEGDPVVQTMLQARRMRTKAEPDLAGAAKIVDEALAKKPDDVRLVSERVGIYAQGGDIAGAKAFLDKKIEQYPDSAVLKTFRTQLAENDPVKARLAIIDESQMPPVDKALQKYLIMRQAGLIKEAAPLLAEAAKAAPEDERVVDLLFVEAIEAKDMAKARQIAARGAEKNLDQLNGLLFQARLEMAEEKHEAAAGTLERITQQAPFNAPAWRMLGQANLNVGRVDKALEAFKRALEIRPTDPSMIRPYLAALVRIGRLPEALDVARKAVARAPDDSAVQMLLLELEESSGDKKAAIDARRILMARTPDDIGNVVSLARMLIDTKDVDGAAKVVERIPAEGRNGSIRVLLTGQIMGMRGDIDGGVKLVRDHIATLTSPAERLDMEVTLAEMFTKFGRSEDAMRTLEAARANQDPAKMEIDRRLGDISFERQVFDKALESYTRVVEGKADTDGTVAKRRVETLIRMQRWDDAEKAVAAIEAGSKRDLQTAMLLAEVSLGRGDARKAKTLLDEAATIAPTSHLPFLRRAQVQYNEDDQFAAVMRDLEQVLKLRPDLTLARQMRAGLLFRRGRDEDALQETRRGVEANPQDDELRLQLIADLMRLKRNEDARATLIEAVKQRGEANKIWIVRSGDIFQRLGDLRGALEAYTKGWQTDKSIDTLGRLVDMQLRMNPPLAADAVKTIDGAPKEMRDAHPDTISLLRARIASAQGKDADAKRILTEVWPKLRSNPTGVRVWFEQVDLINKTDPAKTIEFVKTISPNLASLDPVARVMVATRLSRLQDKSRWIEAMTLTEGIGEEVKDIATIAQAHRVRGQIFYLSEDYAKAAEEYEAGARVAPQDAEFSNNLAYTLGKHMNDLEKATKYAERAALLDPSNANILDTLGWLHLRSNRLTAAEQTLTRALDAAANDEERLPIHVHMAQTRLAQGNKADAAKHAQEAEALLAKNPLVGQSYRTEMDEINKRLRGAE